MQHETIIDTQAGHESPRVNLSWIFHLDLNQERARTRAGRRSVWYTGCHSCRSEHTDRDDVYFKGTGISFHYRREFSGLRLLVIEIESAKYSFAAPKRRQFRISSTALENGGQMAGWKGIPEAYIGVVFRPLATSLCGENECKGYVNKLYSPGVPFFSN